MNRKNTFTMKVYNFPAFAKDFFIFSKELVALNFAVHYAETDQRPDQTS